VRFSPRVKEVAHFHHCSITLSRKKYTGLWVVRASGCERVDLLSVSNFNSPVLFFPPPRSGEPRGSKNMLRDYLVAVAPSLAAFPDAPPKKTSYRLHFFLPRIWHLRRFSNGSSEIDTF
jgi:hypothetical protein